MRDRESNRGKGSRYEEQAAAYLTERGYSLLEKNYRCCMGEIDLIAMEREILVFIEVKYRKDTKKGYPQEAVTYQKQQKIYQSAQFYMTSRHLSEQTLCRFDVVAILGNEIKVIQNAFGGL